MVLAPCDTFPFDDLAVRPTLTPNMLKIEMIWYLIQYTISDQTRNQDEPVTSDGDNYASAANRQRAGVPCQAVEDGGQPGDGRAHRMVG